MQVKISDYIYELNDDRIAKYPVEPRDNSKLLFYEKEKISHHHFTDIVDTLPKNTHLVLNNTKVIPARMFFKRETGAIIEIFLLNPVSPSNVISLAMEAKFESVWECVIGNKKKWKTDEILHAEVEINAHTVSIQASFANREENEVKISWNSAEFSRATKLPSRGHWFRTHPPRNGWLWLPAVLFEEFFRNHCATLWT